MSRYVLARTRMAAWLLCIVLAWLSVGSPHCDHCDGPFVTTIISSPQPLVGHPAPPEPDDCNGVCSCCGFHWLLAPHPIMRSILTVRSAPPMEASSLLLSPHSAFFRPPRPSVSS